MTSTRKREPREGRSPGTVVAVGIVGLARQSEEEGRIRELIALEFKLSANFGLSAASTFLSDVQRQKVKLPDRIGCFQFSSILGLKVGRGVSADSYIAPTFQQFDRLFCYYHFGVALGVDDESISPV